MSTGVKSWCTGLIVFAVVGSVYMRTLYASVPGGDSGELVAESCQLGTAHPPGYPLYTLLAHPFTRGGGNVAWKVNAENAALGAASAGLLSVAATVHAGRLSEHSHAAGLLVGLAFGLAPLPWYYHVGAEVFALNNFCNALLLLLTALAADPARHWAVEAGALASGVALTNQHTAALFLPALVGFVLHRHRATVTRARFLRLAGLFLVGLAPYAYLPIAATLSPHAGSWGDVRSLGGLFHHLRRGDYGTLRLFASNETTERPLQRILLCLHDLQTQQVPGIGLLLLAAGIATALAPARFGGAAPEGTGVARAEMTPLGAAGEDDAAKGSSAATERNDADEVSGGGGVRRRRGPRDGRNRSVRRGVAAKARQRTTTPAWPRAFAGPAFVAAWGTYMVVFHVLANLPLHQALLAEIHSRFWMQPLMAALLLSAAPLALCLGAAKRRLGSWGSRAAFVVFAAALGWRTLAIFPQQDMSDATYMADYARAILDPLPPNSFLLLNYDMAWTSVRYVQECEGHRTDVVSVNPSMMSYPWFATHAHLYPNLTFPGPRPHLTAAGARAGGFTARELLDANIDAVAARGGRIHIVGQFPNTAEETLSDAYDFVPLGLSARVQPKKDRSLTVAAHTEAFLRAWQAVRRRLPRLPPPEKFDARLWESTIVREHWAKLEKGAAYLLDAGIKAGSPLAPLARAAHALEVYLANEEAGLVADTAYKNLGLAYANLVKSPHKASLRQGENPLATTDAAAGYSVTAFLPENARWPAVLDSMDADSWSSVASVETVHRWQHFLSLPGSKADPSFAVLTNVVATLKAALRQSS